MNDQQPQVFRFDEVCDVDELSAQIIIDIVAHGIIEPKGAEPESWIFDAHMIIVAKKACRLHRDLSIDWSGVALAIHLLDELEQLRLENQQLHHRLQRFINSATSTIKH